MPTILYNQLVAGFVREFNGSVSQMWSVGGSVSGWVGWFVGKNKAKNVAPNFNVNIKGIVNE